MSGVWDLAPPVAQDVWSLAPAVGGSVPGARQAKDLGDAIISGLQSSATGLAIRGKLPEQQLGEDAPWYHRLASGAAGMAADLPLSVVGAVGGSVAGSAIAPGPGTVIGGGAGAFGVPMALRDALIEAYSHNYATSWEGVWEIAKAAMKGGAKGAVIGGATAGAGQVVARTAGSMIAPSVGTTLTAKGAIQTIEASALGAELATLTGASAALEGHMPTWQDFMDNAILLGGMKAATHTAQGLRNIYAQTGRRPEQVVADAQRDPAISEALARRTLEIPESYRGAALEQRIQSAIDADARPEMIRKVLSGEKEWVPIGDSPLADPVKYEYITDRETAAGVMRAVSQLYQNEITAQTRGEVPNRQTAIEALKAVSNGEVVERTAGEAHPAWDIYARAHMLRGATNDAVTQLKKIASIPEAELTPMLKMQGLAAIERVTMLQAEFSGAAAEAGRALQIFRAIKRDPNFLGDAETIIKLAERKGNLQDIARFVEQLKDPAQVAEFMRHYEKATTIEKVQEGWKAAILSGPQTHLANIAGNLTKYIVEVPENVIAASLTAINKAAHGEPLTLAQWKARAFSAYYGIQHGAKDALHVAAEVWRGQGEHLEKADVYRTAIEGKKGEIIRTPFKALQVEDALFRTVAERAKAYEMAVDRVVKEGLHPETKEARDRIVLYTQRPEIGMGDAAGARALEMVREAGAEAVFSQRLGPKMEMLQRATQGSLLGFVVPFVRTPTNLVSWAIQHVPGMNVMSGRWRNDFMAGGEQRSRAIARVIIGTGLTITAYQLAKDGIITGGGLFDKEEGGTKRAAGWQPYSVKINDKYYSFQRIEPVAKVIGLAADLIELSEASKEEEDKAKIAAMIVLMFGNATVSTTYLSGVSNAIQAVTDPKRFGENFLEQYATSLVPKIIGQTTAMADPYKREVEGVMDAIQSQIPFLREKLMPKRDVWGEPVKNERWFGVMPVATSTASHDKVKTEAVRLELAIQDAPRFMMEKGPFNPKDKRLELTQEQRDIHREVSGKFAMEILTPIVNAPDWDRIPDFAKAAIYKGVLEAGRKQGAQAALPADDAARVQLRQKIVDRIIKETQEADLKATPR